MVVPSVGYPLSCSTQGGQVLMCSVNTQSWRCALRLKFKDLSRHNRLCHLGFPWRQECRMSQCSSSRWVVFFQSPQIGGPYTPEFLIPEVWGSLHLEQVSR